MESNPTGIWWDWKTQPDSAVGHRSAKEHWEFLNSVSLTAASILEVGDLAMGNLELIKIKENTYKGRNNLFQ